MKYFWSYLMVFFFQVFSLAQDYNGTWKGDLDVMGQKLPLVFHIAQQSGAYSSTIDSPMQGALGIKMDKTEVDDKGISITNTSMNMVFKGRIQDGTLKGDFIQNGLTLPLVLSKTTEEATVLNRPQTPTPPFDYTTEDFTIKNEVEGNVLAGTLVIPKNYKKTSPVVVMITGSGAQNRDEQLFGHKPFLVIADDLAKKGIASFRMDDRGVGGSEKGKDGATSADFATDISSAVDDLAAHGFKTIGLLGHSEGGMIAPMVANMNKKVKYMVLLAAPGIPISDLMVIQNDNMGRLAGLPDDVLKKNKKINEEIYAYVKNYKGQHLDQDIRGYMEKELKSSDGMKMTDDEIQKLIQDEVKVLTNPWYVYFLKFNPEEYLSKVKIPVLALNGSLDMQVSARENLEGIRKSLAKAGDRYFEVVEMPGLNHLFQTAKTGSPSEYGQIEQTIAPEVLKKISEWIWKLPK